MVDPLGRGRKGSRSSEGSHMQLVEDQPLGRDTFPLRVGPGVGIRIHDLARAVDAVGLKARGRVGHEERAIDLIAIARARRRLGGGQRRPAVGIAGHGQDALPLVQPQCHAVGAGSPEPEARDTVVAGLGPERHAPGAPEGKRHGLSSPRGAAVTALPPRGAPQGRPRRAPPPTMPARRRDAPFPARRR